MTEHKGAEAYCKAVAAGCHTFEAAGLGKAPFKFIGYEEKLHQAAPGEPVKAGGSCQYCFQSVRHAYWIKSADGKKFYVGSECVNKTGDKGLVDHVKREANRQKRAQQVDREEARIAKSVAKLADEAVRAELESRPHPKGFTDRETGKALTALDWVEWFLANAGHRGKLQIARYLDKV